MYTNRVIICGVDTAKLPVLREKEKTELLNSIMLPEISKKIEEIMNTLKVAGKEYILLDAPTYDVRLQGYYCGHH